MRKIILNSLGHPYYKQIAGIEIDDIYRFLDPEFRAADYSEVWKQARESTGSLANGMLNGSVEIVFIFGNTIFSEEQVEDIKKHIKVPQDIAFYHITLAPARDKLHERLVERESTVPEWLDYQLAERQPFLGAEWTNVIDNSWQTPEETVAVIYNIMEQGNTMHGKVEGIWVYRVVNK
ncbi:hypothetical protein JCM9157_65 [Halalkalibacter akibai JCM 9157]|uniref:Shikimate kinase n=2 Tax=Halalkalibacter akibai TaxID=1411 RepID=W4QN46_HALA3|nr:hypothetical protein JCM9157_65 [Halalkalibacter akibai JCM 9157]